MVANPSGKCEGDTRRCEVDSYSMENGEEQLGISSGSTVEESYHKTEAGNSGPKPGTMIDD